MTNDNSANNPVPNFYRASAADFKKIYGSPIAYWVSESEKKSFRENYIIDVLDIKSGLLTGKDDLFLKLWFEVSHKEIPFHLNNSNQISKVNPKWLPVTGGGNFRKWYGNLFSVVNSRNDFFAIKNLKGNNYRLRDHRLYFQKAVNWPMISSVYYGAKLSPENIVLGNGVRTGFVKNSKKTSVEFCVSYLSSVVANNFLKIINPTLNYNNENIAVIPLNYSYDQLVHNNGCRNILLSKSDWDAYETSWNFVHPPFLQLDYRQPTMKGAYTKLRAHWREIAMEMQRLEEENNRIFIEAYDLQDELTPEVPLSEITLTCNPHYRYNGYKSEEELEALLLTDTIKELISYAVGCMFGRYSPDKEGLILANQGETINDFREKVPDASFMPDDDNIIPILDDDYFTDDIVGRFKEFLKTTFGAETLSENLDFIAGALSKSKKSNTSPEKVIRDYFLKDFFKDHVKMYKKRPIYWLFTSGKGRGFNALVYMHRYNRETLAKMRTDYLLKLEDKLDARIGMLSKGGNENETDKPLLSERDKQEMSRLSKLIDELTDYDAVLNNKALEFIEIDLDDGVTVNYAKFEGLVGKI